MPNWIIYIAAIYALIFASTYLIVFQRLLRFALQDPNYEIVPKESIPPHLRELFQQKVADLQVLGFTFCCCLLVKPIAGYAQNLENQVLMYHRSTKTYAAISIRYPVESVNLFSIDFYTFFADKTLLMTVNGRLHSVIDEIPNTIANDPYAPTLEAQWRSHEDKLLLNEANKSIALPPEKFVQALEDLNRLYLDRMLQTQKIAQVADTEFFQLSWQVAWQTTVKLQRGIAKANQMLKLQREAAKSNPNLPIEVPIELEIESFYRVQQAHQGILKRGFGIWLLLGSLVLFAASFSLMQIPINLIILIGVVFFHEAGHYLTMRLCGYADTSVFFIPFFGAAATGRKQDASVRDKFLVLLGGPLPGLLIGSGLFLFSLHGAVYPDWLQETMFMLIGLNLFNLLPIYPLDGGKIVDLVFFSRYPFTDVLFKVIAVIALLALSLSSPLLIGLAVVVAITIPSGFRSAKLFSNLRTELKKSPTNDVNTLLATIFQAMRQFGHHNLPFAQRYNLAKTALERCQEVRSRRSTRIGLIVVYLVCLFSLPIAVFGQTLLFMFSPYRTAQIEAMRKKAEIQQKKYFDKKMVQANQALKANPKDRKALVDRADIKRYMKDFKGAMSDYTKAIALNPKDADGYIRRAGLRSELKQYQAALSDYSIAQQLYPNAPEIDFQRINVYQSMGNNQKVIEETGKLLKSDPKNQGAYYMRSFARQKLGDIQGAEQDKQKAISLESTNPEATTDTEVENPTFNAQIAQTFQHKVAIANLALRFNPKDRKAYIDRADAHNSLRQFKESINDYSKALQLYPKDMEVYAKRTRVYAAMNNHKKATEEASQILRNDPENVEAYAIRAGSRHQLGDLEGAKQDNDKMSELVHKQIN